MNEKIKLLRQWLDNAEYAVAFTGAGVSTDSGKHFPASAVADCDGIPYCDCGGVIHPGILLFGEIPDMHKVMALVKELKRSDLLLVAGSSLQVSSAHRLLKNYKGKLVILNLDPTPYDDRADLVINDRLRPIFEELWPME